MGRIIGGVGLAPVRRIAVTLGEPSGAGEQDAIAYHALGSAIVKGAYIAAGAAIGWVRVSVLVGLPVAIIVQAVTNLLRRLCYLKAHLHARFAQSDARADPDGVPARHAPAGEVLVDLSITVVVDPVANLLG
jgi:hypothetical protein